MPELDAEALGRRNRRNIPLGSAQCSQLMAIPACAERRESGVLTPGRSGWSRVHGYQTIGVIGAGQMGSGIAHVCALAGYEVRLNDINAKALDAGGRH